jgi:hypothetical protein
LSDRYQWHVPVTKHLLDAPHGLIPFLSGPGQQALRR